MRRRFDHPGQLALEGFDATPLPTDRLFFALLPDAGAAERIGALKLRTREQHGLTGREVPSVHLHVTLHMLGDHSGLPAGLLTAAHVAAEALAELPVAPFELTFDRTASLPGTPGNRPFVLRMAEGATALTVLQEALAGLLRQVGLGSSVRAVYTPHVTLCYDKKSVDEQPTEPITWTAREFVLVNSLIGQTRHVALARWPLHG